ncbi:hypothetical protein Pcinc_029009 [Petrolisthes cinctipes]|uniref:Uncharacterized protein n=1 Tax=Petrolisthes cinctipes TaxID=88211 RepID=A0AAE1K871_PETCI|nr:hypothetical protein Pcinc_029009 [Petrolisthes cinctipes]
MNCTMIGKSMSSGAGGEWGTRSMKYPQCQREEEEEEESGGGTHQRAWREGVGGVNLLSVIQRPISLLQGIEGRTRRSQPGTQPAISQDLPQGSTA